jgi:ABC-type multidrug transport system ATPase subunit
MATATDSNSTGIAVELQSISHTFKSRPVFDPVTALVPAGSECLIRGTNGSGKSTLGRILAGELTPAEGQVTWQLETQAMEAEDLCLRSQRVSPVTALHPQLTIAELIVFQCKFQPWSSPSAASDLLNKAGLAKHMGKAYRELSSGMQQRVKLALALAAQSGLIVLDEPCANLDTAGIAWYRESLQTVRGKTTLIVCSNDREEDFVDPNVTIDL